MTRRFLILPTILALAFVFPQTGRADDQPGCDDGAWGSVACSGDTGAWGSRAA